MATQAPITAFDGAATPVSHTFTEMGNRILPDGTQLSMWRETLSGLPSSASPRVELRQKTLKSGVVETRFDVIVPVMESIAGQNAQGYTAAPKVAFEDRAAFVGYAHPRSTPNSRQIAMQLLRNILNNVSTTVTPVAAGVVDSAARNQSMPT